jgi:hypothetical protein
MNCKECRDLLSEYCDSDLDGTKARAVKAHLKKCADCREQNNLTEAMEAAARALPHHAPGTECLLNTSAAIHKIAGFTRQTEFGPVLDFQELAEFLRVDREIVGQYLDEIPSFELGGKLLFRRKSVEDWIESKETGFRLQQEPVLSREPVFFTAKPIIIGGMS